MLEELFEESLEELFEELLEELFKDFTEEELFNEFIEEELAGSLEFSLELEDFSFFSFKEQLFFASTVFELEDFSTSGTSISSSSDEVDEVHPTANAKITLYKKQRTLFI